MLNRRQLLAAPAVILGLAEPSPGLSAETKKRKSAGATAQPSQTRKLILTGVKRWGYQLRLINFAEVAASDTDLVVIDHGFSDGLRFIRHFEPSEIAILKQRPDGRRRHVISYLSIGEAERYRFYWQNEWFEVASKPEWLQPMNPRWAGNYPVDFWHPGWQQIIASYVDFIARQGFDGVYLDRADVFQEVAGRHPKPSAAMAAFIRKIATRARAANPNALVIMQNAEELISDPLVATSIDAIAKEDLYYGVDYQEGANTSATIRDAERDLLRAKQLGKRIFVVEYLTDARRIADVEQRCIGYGFVPYFGPRLLGSLIANPLSLTPEYRGPLVPQENASP